MSVQVSRNPSVDFAPMKSESVLFQPKTNQFCLLNATATFLWTQLDQPRSTSELADRLCERFDAIVTGTSASGTWVRIGAPLAEGRLVQGFEGLDVGDRVRVQLRHTDVQRGFIDFARVRS